MMLITFLDDKGRHQFGSITFEDGENLPGLLQCNGAKQNNIGVSACQAKSGTFQAIDFGVPVRTSDKMLPGCNLPKGVGKEWTIKVAEGFCMYVFESEHGAFHKLTTFGYNELIPQ